MDPHTRYPEIEDLAHRAKRRLPKFVWEYLDSGTGSEATRARNRTAFDRVGFEPSILHGPQEADPGTRFLGHDLPLPIGAAPIGMAGLIWPQAEILLARAMAKAGLPYCQSTVASRSPEDVSPHLGQHSWFQLYPPKDPDIRRDMLARARDAGFTAMVLTADVPVASRRERLLRSGLTQPPHLTPRLLAQVAMRPAWAVRTALTGMPHMRTLDKYVDATSKSLGSTAHVGYLLRTSPDWDYVTWLRDQWQGPLIVKGVLRARDATKLEQAGVDAIWVSNHAGRQFDAPPPTIEVLPRIRAATTLPLIFDSGVTGGLDILRAIALGADLVMLGRAFMVALAVMGAKGPAHVLEILHRDLTANMGQLGAPTLKDLPEPIEFG